MIRIIPSPYLHLVLIWAVLAGVLYPVQAESLRVPLSFSRVRYEENVSLLDVDSSWEAYAWGIAGKGSVAASVGSWIGEIGYLITETKTEMWKTGAGQLVQSNQMQVEMLELAAGWQSPEWQSPHFGSHQVSLRATYGFQQFVRSRFIQESPDGPEPLGGRVVEDVFTAGVAVGWASRYELSPRWQLGLEAEWETIFWEEATNTAFDARISGTGGYSLSGGVGIMRQPPKSVHRMGVWLRAQQRVLKGGSSLLENVAVEWPENTWEDVRLELEWAVRL